MGSLLVVALYPYVSEIEVTTARVLLSLCAALLISGYWSYRRYIRVGTPVPNLFAEIAGSGNGASDGLHPLLLKSATEMAQMIRTRQVTSTELVELAIKQCERVNERLNAVVQTRYKQAREEAAAADARVHELYQIHSGSSGSSGGGGGGAALQKALIELPVFFGVPTTVKECFAMIGFDHTSGLASRTGNANSVTADASCVRRMQRAGGLIVIGRTNLSELCMWYESYNPVYGRTHNPYDLRRTVGGSSGGEGAIISAGAVPMGLGSDVGGSIRMPSFFCGIFGHKPSGGSVPNTGQHPPSVGRIQRYCQPGPMCRSALDLWPLFMLLHGPDGVEQECGTQRQYWRDNLLSPVSVKLPELTFYYLADSALDSIPLVSRVNWELKHSIQRVVQHMASAYGCRIAQLKTDDFTTATTDSAGALLKTNSNKPHKLFNGAFDLWSNALAAEHGPTFRSLLLAGSDPSTNLGLELFKSLCGKSKFTTPAIGLALIEKIPELIFGDKLVARSQLKLETVKQNLNRLLGDRAVLVVPPHPLLAPYHNHPIWRPFNFVFTGLFNCTELPATACPMGLSAVNGLPLGVQIVGGYGMDHVTVAVAQEIERKFGGWQPPKPMRDA